MRWLLLAVVAFMACSSGVSALRCYICEDCDENSQLTEMEVCDGTPVSSSPSPGPSPSPGAAASPSPASPAAPAAPPSEEEDYDSDESSTVGIMAAGNAGATGAGAAAGGTAAGGTATGGAATEGAATGGAAAPESAAESEEEEEEEEEEEDDERRRRSSARQAQLDAPTAFCYIVRLHLNESVITKRGCTTARMSNETGGCEGLFENWSVGGCQLCQDDGCNRPLNESSMGILGLESSLALTLMAIVGRFLI